MTTTIKLSIPGIDKPVEFIEKKNKEIKKCEKDTIIIVAGYHGRFVMMDGEYVRMKPLSESSFYEIGFTLRDFKTYFEEIKTN